MSQVIVTTREELSTIIAQTVRRELCCVMQQTAAASGDGILTPQQAADYLIQSVNTLRQWRSQGRGPAYEKRGRNIRYRKQDLDTWRNANVIVTAEALESHPSARTAGTPRLVEGVSRA